MPSSSSILWNKNKTTDRLHRYFAHFYETKKDVSHFSNQDVQIYYVRGHIDSLLLSSTRTAGNDNDVFSKIEGILIGVMYSDRDFASQVVLWRDTTLNTDDTLLGRIILQSNQDPPLSLLRLMVDIAPTVVTKRNALGSLPLHDAIWKPTQSQPQRWCSLDIVKFLCQADTSRESLTTRTKDGMSPLEMAAFRQDENVARLLLSYPEVRNELIQQKVNGPLDIACRDLFLSEGGKKNNDDDEEWMAFWVYEIAKNTQGATPCCMSRALDACRNVDVDLLRRQFPPCRCHDNSK